MILTSMYTANLTAHLTLERSNIHVSELDDLLKQHEYTWGLITDRNLESMMENHGNNKYQALVDRAVKLDGLQEGIERVKDGKFVFIDDSSVITYNFRDSCQSLQTFTGKFQNQWAFGMQMNSPYSGVINDLILRYRESGWIVSKFDRWYKSGRAASCPSSVGSDTKFDLPILSGLFLILAIGAILSFAVMLLEILYVTYNDCSQSKQNFLQCLKVRLYLIKSKRAACDSQ